MSLTVELLFEGEESGFTARRLTDIPAYGEGETEEAAIADLEQALRGHIETFSVQVALPVWLLFALCVKWIGT